ncbi:MAG TPA: lipid-A-disaccharide synthase [Bryobacteraceae bacterium]|nr:lipid-A-disaccharide synthase [Bryobacteraceae bacterium]
MPPKILISAGEASGDLYASKLVEAVRARLPEAEFFGCTGPRMRAAGVRTVVDAASLAVVGLFEVISHIPRIYNEFRKLVRTAESERPDLAILTDSPDFNLRVARRLNRLGIPVFYLVAPQVWAWRRGRLPGMRRSLHHLLCIFPFEEQFFRTHGIPATYIGHPLAHFVRPELTKHEFRQLHGLNGAEPVIALLPGSRHGEVSRHLPAVLDAAVRIARARPVRFVLALPAGRFVQLPELTYFTERNPAISIQVIEGATWDVLAWSDIALAASGTVTVEAALLGTPMVVFYRVSALSWLAGKFLVRVPFYSMPNLIAGQAIVPELMQNEMSGERLAAEALRLLDDDAARAAMRRGLADVAARLAAGDDPMGRAAVIIEDFVWQSRENQIQ